MSLPLSDGLPKTSNMPLDMNIYATRKTVAQGMMDIALMTANASQLKYVLLNSTRHKYLEATIALIITSIAIQVRDFAVLSAAPVRLFPDSRPDDAHVRLPCR